MKILTITNLYPRPDKPQRGLYNKHLFVSIANAGCEVDNICMVPEWRCWRWDAIRKWRMEDKLNSSYEPVMYTPLVNRAGYADLYFRSLRKRLPDIGEVDFVYSSWLYPDGVVAARMADEFSVPYAMMALGSDILHLQTQDGRREQILDACKGAQFVVCVATHLKDALLEAGVDEKKVCVVDNGVDASIFCYRDKQKTLEKLETIEERTARQMLSGAKRQIGNWKLVGEKIILFVGNLVKVKGGDKLISAFAELSVEGSVKKIEGEIRNAQQSTTNYQLIIIGEGPERKSLARQAERLGIADRVRFLGGRPQDEVALWMNVADCLCLPSRSEGMPNVVIEALSSGLPVVATDVGECSRMLSDESCSRIVYDGDVGSMSGELEKVLSMSVDRQSMAERSQGKYSWGKMAREILGEIYKSGNLAGIVG